MKNDPKDWSIQKKMDYYGDAMNALLHELGFQSAVFVLRIGDDQYVAGRFPSCADTCATVDECTAKVFAEASEGLREQADEIRNKTAEVLRHGSNRRKGFIQ